MHNPFDSIEQRLTNIEVLLTDIQNAPKPSTPTNSKSERLTRKELSQTFKISLGTIHNLMKTGKLPYEKIGRKTIFKTEEVEAYFSGNKKEPQ